MKTLPLVFRFSGAPRTFAALLALAVTLTTIPRAVASDAKASELMEQGVYSEETKGDLEAAIQFYRQVVAEADAGQALGAQAQFRLAVCFEKKKDQAAARAAFEKLVHDFPSQQDWVARANERLAAGPDLLPAPWVEGEEMNFELKLPSGMKIGVSRYAVATVDFEGRKVWRLDSHLFVPGSEKWCRTEVDAVSFKPIHCKWKIPPAGVLDVRYADGRAAVRMNDKDEVKTFDLAGAVYDSEEAVPVLRRVPLAAGYRTSGSLFSAWGGKNMHLQLEVTGSERIQVSAGTFDCFKVETTDAETKLKQTSWISADAHRYLVRADLGGLVEELASVSCVAPGGSVNYRDPVFGFTVKAPAGTLLDREEAAEETKQSTVRVLDADALGVTEVRTRRLSDFEPAVQASPRAFAEFQVGDVRKYFKSLIVRPGSWTAATIAGSPAVSCVADVVHSDGHRQIVLMVDGFLGGNVVEFWTNADEATLAAYQPRFAAIVASFQGK